MLAGLAASMLALAPMAKSCAACDVPMNGLSKYHWSVMVYEEPSPAREGSKVTLRPAVAVSEPAFPAAKTDRMPSFPAWFTR